MCSCLKQLPHGFADRAEERHAKKGGGGGGKEGREALGPMRAFVSRRWEFSSKAAGARAQPQSSCGARSRYGPVPSTAAHPAGTCPHPAEP